MKYIEPFTFLFKQSHALMTLLIGSALFFIPVVGPLVLMGWIVLVHHSLMNGEEEIPALTFDDFSKLLNLGLGPFVASLIFGLVLSMVLTPLFMIPWFGLGVAIPIMAQTGNESIMPIIAIVGALIFFVLFNVVIIVTGMLQNVILLRAELNPDVNESLKSLGFPYIKEVFRFAKKELFLASIVLTLGGVIISTAGLLILMVGIYPAAVIAMAAGVHFRAQIYGAYLAKGGTPLPVQPLEFGRPGAQPGAPLPYASSNQ